MRQYISVGEEKLYHPLTSQGKNFDVKKKPFMRCCESWALSPLVIIIYMYEK